jgi:hypothetical protein
VKGSVTCWAIIFMSVVIGCRPNGASAESSTSDKVPFVGCAADGQMGPEAAPSAGIVTPAVPMPAAPRLAYYASKYFHLLAPRGWHCFALYGSSGTVLFVTPEQHGTDLFDWKNKIRGPVVELSYTLGGTSGRFQVAQTAARIFPIAKSFIEDVINEGLEPKTDFVFGPYPADIIARRSQTVVEYFTPEGSDGLGTSDGRIVKGDLPIHGITILRPQDDMDLVMLAVRLPSDFQDLSSAIIAEVERNNAMQQTEPAVH